MKIIFKVGDKVFYKNNQLEVIMTDERGLVRARDVKTGECCIYDQDILSFTPFSFTGHSHVRPGTNDEYWGLFYNYDDSTRYFGKLKKIEHSIFICQDGKMWDAFIPFTDEELTVFKNFVNKN